MQRSRGVWIGLVLGLSVAAVAPRVARADGTTWQFVEVVPAEPTEKVPDPPPNLRIRVIGETAPSADDRDRFKLELSPDDNRRRLRGVAPTTITPFHRSSDSLAITVLVEGHQYYLGNNKYVTESGTTTDAAGNITIIKMSPGVYDAIVNMFDAPGGDRDGTPTTISTASANAASKGSLIVYSVGADVRYPMGKLSELRGDKLGPQELQKGKTGRDLAEGLRAAFAQLRGVAATRRVLFVISDGYDNGSLDEIRGLRRQFDNEKIDIFAFHLVAPSIYIPSSEADLAKNRSTMQALAENGEGAYYAVRDAAALPAKVASAIEIINSRYYLTFPGQVQDARSKVKSGFDWDGKEHEIRLLHDDEPVGEKNQVVVFAPVWGQPKATSNWWMWVVFPLGGAVVLAGIIALATRKPAPAPQPVMAPPPPVAAPPPTIQPAAAGSNKTMAINLNSGDGVPVVGWLVPINGPQQFQTLKLFAGVTKVGNAHGAHILINDAFMSGEHAHVVMSPGGFTLIDNGSTNGTFVNERRVQRHELIDNDVVKFGKTDCKFKTINTDA